MAGNVLDLDYSLKKNKIKGRVWYDWFPADHCIRSHHHSSRSSWLPSSRALRALPRSQLLQQPVLSVLGFPAPVDIALVVMAIGAGTMTVSHANDSYFWVVTNFGDMQPEDGYKTQTLMTLIIGLASMVEIFILSLIF